ncbi:MAG TPA: DUF3137 domain-containing protein [Bacteroidia bacterium]|jgi:hypothetical protein|nr:DUF3137 domain-containing protein [Bacteroidia bacterium]
MTSPDKFQAFYTEVLEPRLRIVKQYAYLDEYSSRFGKEIMAPIVHFHDPALQFEEEDGIMLNAVEISRIFGDSFQEFSSENLVKGKVGNTWVQFSNVTLLHNTWGMKSSFCGEFLIAEFSKKFSGEYYVISNDTKAKLSSGIHKFLQQGNRIRPSVIKVDNPEFEKEFTVFGSDTVEALYILSPSLMQRMLGFKKKIQAEVHFSFTRSRIFAALESSGKPTDAASSEDGYKKYLLDWNQNLEFALDLAKDLNLDTKIWSKQ